MNGTGTAPFIPSMFPHSRGVTPQASDWNGYQVLILFHFFFYADKTIVLYFWSFSFLLV
jgi:hypothetical protein